MRQYDGLDDLTKAQTARGEVGYFYDNANRRQTLTAYFDLSLARIRASCGDR